MRRSEFVDILMSDDEDNRISIALVPFNGQVNLGPALRAEYNATDIPYRTNVACVDLPSSVYGTQTIGRTLPLPSTGYVDTFSSTNRSYYYTSPYSYGPNPSNVWCPDSSANHVRLPTTNQGDLNSAIGNLNAIGATSINAGMRWGMTLLDPSFAPIMQHQIALGNVPGNLTGRPFGYRTPNTMKVIVLMTDGEHFAEERLNAGYRSGPSTIFRGNDGYYSMYYDRSNTSNDYWVPHRSEWRSQAWPQNSQATRMDWRQVWDTMRVSYVAWEFYGRGLGGGSSYNRNYYYELYYDQMRTRTPIDAMNAQLQQMCDRARNERVIVFGVSFDAPDAGREQIFDCSFTPSHFYNAALDDIGDVFEAIANQIKSLRLVQ
ncbi:hypothetical protein Wenmar_03003 [Wenxinia marina DSM 24838]|uniref:VWFA domain-containing protein n=1 Tax=Wenxinia marina DSM 24838 TaxID=1123501 RepID=A0A0D0PA21_9RHOB|nr:hypothetical protein Wenmar_03003 [Wenxinia marina DSM 24838]